MLRRVSEIQAGHREINLVCLKFNARCRESVFRDLKEWNALTERIGFWVDLDQAYITPNELDQYEKEDQHSVEDDRKRAWEAYTQPIMEERLQVVGLIDQLLAASAHKAELGKIKEGLRGYKEINLRAIKMINPGGFLITCSCSHFFSREDFLDVINKAAFDAHRRIKLLAYKTQPYDHPILLPLYQSEYLKCALLAVD